MRLSAWRAAAPAKESMTPKVMAALEPILGTLGADADPECWILWGDDPRARYVVLAPIPAGLVVCGVRVNVPQEGPRVSGKLVRWGKVQLSDLAVEGERGHRLISFQIEQNVLRGIDEEADQIAEFVALIYAALDGRALPQPARGK